MRQKKRKRTTAYRIVPPGTLIVTKVKRENQMPSPEKQAIFLAIQARQIRDAGLA